MCFILVLFGRLHRSENVRALRPGFESPTMKESHNTAGLRTWINPYHPRYSYGLWDRCMFRCHFLQLSTLTIGWLCTCYCSVMSNDKRKPDHKSHTFWKWQELIDKIRRLLSFPALTGLVVLRSTVVVATVSQPMHATVIFLFSTFWIDSSFRLFQCF